MQKISNLILHLQEAELPLAKLEILLSVIQTSIDATTMSQRGQALGADDFLPLLVYIVGKCGFIGAEIEAEFMWCLLQPSLLNGEAGYYLTALSSATHVLKTFKSSANTLDGNENSDVSNEKHLSHRKNFLSDHHHFNIFFSFFPTQSRVSAMPSCSSVLRVIIPDEYNGSLQTRTLPVRPHTTTKDVCRIIAHKARVTNPQDYGLFKLVDGEGKHWLTLCPLHPYPYLLVLHLTHFICFSHLTETLLLESECPQEARLEARGKPCMLAYKRIEAKIAWPTTSSVFQ